MVNRRAFLKQFGAVSLGVLLPRQAPIGIGIIGVGKQGLRRLVQLLDLSRVWPVRVVGVCDVDPAACDRATQLAAKLRQTSDYRELLAWPDLHAAIIATPDASHASIAETALNQGIDLYIEAPMTRTPAEAEHLVRIAAASEAIVQIGAEWDARALILPNDITRIQITLGITRGTWHGQRVLSSGQAAVGLAQAIQAIRDLTDGMLPRTITLQAGVYLWRDTYQRPDTLFALLDYGRFLANVAISDHPHNSFTVHGTGGELTLRADDQALLEAWLGALRRRDMPTLDAQWGLWQVQIAAQIAAACETGERPAVLRLDVPN